MMLARVADSLYWIGRYIERAEHMCRLADVMMIASLEQTESATAIAHIALAAVGDPEDMLAGRSAFDAAKALLFDREDPGSVITSLSLARENARQVRDQITIERVPFPRPRNVVIAAIGEANQSLPVLVLPAGETSQNATGIANGHAFASGSNAILATLAERHGLPVIHP